MRFPDDNSKSFHLIHLILWNIVAYHTRENPIDFRPHPSKVKVTVIEKLRQNLKTWGFRTITRKVFTWFIWYFGILLHITRERTLLIFGHIRPITVTLTLDGCGRKSIGFSLVWYVTIFKVSNESGENFSSYRPETSCFQILAEFFNHCDLDLGRMWPKIDRVLSHVICNNIPKYQMNRVKTFELLSGNLIVDARPPAITKPIAECNSAKNQQKKPFCET